MEIHAAHGLLCGFLSPLYNKRSDKYGGDINGRLRLTLEVVAEARRQCGEDFIIDVRISGDEYTDGGQNLNDAVYVAKQLKRAGADFPHVSGGTTVMRGSSMGSRARLAGTETTEPVSIPCGWVVMAAGSRKAPFSTQGVTAPVTFVGGCSGERTASIAEAVRSGYHAANAT